METLGTILTKSNNREDTTTIRRKLGRLTQQHKHQRQWGSVKEDNTQTKDTFVPASDSIQPTPQWTMRTFDKLLKASTIHIVIHTLTQYEKHVFSWTVCDDDDGLLMIQRSIIIAVKRNVT